jgi:hypothetical protein
VAIVARISGCASQKEMSLDDQVDHAKEEVANLYQGPIEYRVIATKGKGEALDRPELVEVEQIIRRGDLSRMLTLCFGSRASGPGSRANMHAAGTVAGSTCGAATAWPTI